MTRVYQPLCSARTLAGQPCRNRALRGLDPPLCHAHAPRDSDAWHPPRACSATTRRGKPCRAPAIRDSDPPLCCAHAGRAKPLWPPSRRCKARVRNPRRVGHEICQARAIPGTNPPRCAAHAGLTKPSYPPARACSAVNQYGAPCRAPAAADTDPPRCTVHAQRGGFTLDNTCADGPHIPYSRLRFLQQWLYFYDTVAAGRKVDITWQIELSLCHITRDHFLFHAEDYHALDLHEFTFYADCIFAGQEIILELHKVPPTYELLSALDVQPELLDELPLPPELLNELRLPLGLPEEAHFASEILPPIQTVPPPMPPPHPPPR